MSRKLNVAVVGGTGLIGWHTVKELIKNDHQVRVLARKKPVPELKIEAVPFSHLDLFAATKEDMIRAMDGCDVLIQAAGADPRIVPKGSARDFFFNMNVRITPPLLEAAKEAGVTVAIMLTSYFHPLRPEMASHPYVESRIVSEQQALAMNGPDFRVVVLQPPYVFGVVPGRQSIGDSMNAFSWLPLPLPAGGTNAMSVMALAKAIVGAVEGEARGTYLVGDENLSWGALFKRFGGTSLPLPTFVLRAVMILGKIVLGMARRESGLDPVKLVDTMTSEMFFDPSEGQAVLGYEGGDLDQAIADIKQRKG